MGAVYLIRHGQASFGKPDYDQLSKTGVEQSRVLGQTFRQRIPSVDAVYVGAMKRHRQTADHCLAAYGLFSELRVHRGFDEFDHEEVVARHTPAYANRLRMMAELALTLEPRRAYQRLFEEATARWVSGEHDGEYAESWSGFRARCVGALEDVVKGIGPSRTALVFTSGGPIAAICQHLWHLRDAHVFEMNRMLANAGVTKVIYGERGIHLSTVNEHPHFEGERRHLLTYR